jgi:hypothetical protein
MFHSSLVTLQQMGRMERVEYDRPEIENENPVERHCMGIEILQLSMRSGIKRWSG